MILERLFLISTLSFALLLLVGGSTIAQTMQSPLPKPTGYVNDYAAVIDSATKARMETTLGNLDREQQIQFAVVTVNTTGGQDIFDYSLAVARGWGIGSKDTSKPSLLLLVAIKDRKYFTQVSRHLEGDLPDGLVGQIQREHLVPAFRAGQYGRGLNDTINEYIATVARKNGFSPDTVASGASTPARERSARGNTSFCAPLIIVVLVIVVLAVFVRRTRGPGNRGGPGSSWLPWLLLSLFLNSGRRSGSSGWSGGGFGGFGCG